MSSFGRRRPLARPSGRPSGLGSVAAPVVDGRRVGRGLPARGARRARRLLVSGGERLEVGLERALRGHRPLTRANLVAVMSPKGGVGKTTLSFLLGSLLADRLSGRVVVVDADPEFGTLANLAPAPRRSQRTLVDLLERLDRVSTAAQLGGYVSRLSTGVDLLCGPRAPATASPSTSMATRYGELVSFLSLFYDLVLLDCATGIGRPLARLAASRADQLLVVSTPEWATSSLVRDALAELPRDRARLVLNMSHLRRKQLAAAGRHFESAGGAVPAVVPYDEQLRDMLATATYTLEALGRPTRLAVKRVGAGVVERLV